MRRFMTAGFLACIVSFSSPLLQAGPVTLRSAWIQAQTHDAKLREARADNLASREEIGKARAQLRPNVQVSASRGRNATQHAYLGVWDSPDYYNTLSHGVALRQPVFNLSDYNDYQQSKLIAAKSDIDLRNEEHSLIVRVAEAYCNVLYAEDNLAFSRSRITATKEQFMQAKRRFDSGYGTITEVKEAQAAYDMALAEGMEILENVEYAKRELELITGIYPDQLCGIDQAMLKLDKPVPGNVDAWIERARSGNLVVSSAVEEVKIAGKEIDKSRAARLPSVDLVAGRSYTESEDNYSIGSTYDTYYITLKLNLPIYTGGYVSATARQAQARKWKAEESLSGKERATETEVRKYFNGIIAGIAQIQAYEQAVKASEIAVEGTKKGFAAGFRSNVEVLEAEQRLFEARRNLARARYRYVLNRLMLRQTAGMLTAADVDEVNGWFCARPR